LPLTIHPPVVQAGLEVITMLALTQTQWNWIVTGSAILFLAFLVVTSAILNWRATPKVKKQDEGTTAPPQRQKGEARKAA
jgi:hypothetical protein